MMDTATADLPYEPVPYGYCHCRCGGRTSIAKGTDGHMGWIKGQPVRFILGHSHIDRGDWSERFWEKVDKNGPTIRPDLGPCWLWIGFRDRDGYGVSKVNGRRKAHHVALELAGFFILFEGLEVLHRCDNRPCVRPDHLKIDTKPANIADKVAKSRQAGGERIAKAKLDPEKVREVRALYQRGVPGRGYEALAQRFGVTLSTISRIIQGETWKHIALASIPFVAAVPTTMAAIIPTPMVALSVVVSPRLASAAVIAPAPVPVPVPAPAAWLGGEEVGDGYGDGDDDLRPSRLDVHHRRDCNDCQPDGQQHCD